MFSLLKIHSTKNVSQILMIQLLAKSSSILVIFHTFLPALEVLGTFNFIRVSWLQKDRKWAQSIDKFFTFLSTVQSFCLHILVIKSTLLLQISGYLHASYLSKLLCML